MTLPKDTKQKVVKDSQLHDTDTGSPEVQVSLLTRKIKELSKHLKINRKDKHSRRGLLGMVAKRRKHMKYLEKTDTKRHKAMQKKIKE